MGGNLKREIITSSSNNKIKHLAGLLKKGKLRKEEGVFVCEGRKMFLEVLCQFPERIKEAYFTPELFEELQVEYAEMLSHVNCELVDTKVFNQMAETVTPQGVIAVVEMPEYVLEDLKDEQGVRLLILDDLRDPGNLGTIIRTAEAAGMTGIVLSSESVDVTNPKVVRSTMGAMLRMPIFYTSSIVRTLDTIKAETEGFKVFATALDGATDYAKTDYGTNYGLVIGNEANGVSRQVIEASDACVIIPMKGKVESLNAAVAAALVMFQAKKGRD